MSFLLINSNFTQQNISMTKTILIYTSSFQFFFISISLFAQSSQKFEFTIGLNSAYTHYGNDNKFYTGYQLGVQTTIPLKKLEKNFVCIGLEYNYFGINTSRNNNITENFSIKNDQVFTAFSIGTRRTFNRFADNFFQWNLAFNYSTQAKFGIGPRIAFGFKVIDRDKHKLFLSPQLGLNIFNLNDDFIVMPLYSYASLRLMYQLSFN